MNTDVSVDRRCPWRGIAKKSRSLQRAISEYGSARARLEAAIDAISACSRKLVDDDECPWFILDNVYSVFSIVNKNPDVSYREAERLVDEYAGRFIIGYFSNVNFFRIIAMSSYTEFTYADQCKGTILDDMQMYRYIDMSIREGRLTARSQCTGTPQYEYSIPCFADEFFCFYVDKHSRTLRFPFVTNVEPEFVDDRLELDDVQEFVDNTFFENHMAVPLVNFASRCIFSDVNIHDYMVGGDWHNADYCKKRIDELVNRFSNIAFVCIDGSLDKSFDYADHVIGLRWMRSKKPDKMMSHFREIQEQTYPCYVVDTTYSLLKMSHDRTMNSVMSNFNFPYPRSRIILSSAKNHSCNILCDEYDEYDDDFYDDDFYGDECEDVDAELKSDYSDDEDSLSIDLWDIYQSDYCLDRGQFVCFTIARAFVSQYVHDLIADPSWQSDASDEDKDDENKAIEFVRFSAGSSKPPMQMAINSSNNMSESNIKAFQSFIENLQFSDFYEYFKSRIIGHDDSLAKACFYVWTYLRSLVYKGDTHHNNFIIAGCSGCGKTEFMRVLKNYFCENIPSFSFPVVRLDTTRLSESGWKGLNFEDALVPELYQVTGSTGIGIVFLDEFDKKLIPRFSSGGDNVTGSFQSNLLTVLEGSKVMSFASGGISVDTTNTLFIGLGTFDEARSRISTDSRILGFTGDADEDMKLYWQDITVENVIMQGAKDELVGRFIDIVNFRPLDMDSLKIIVLNHLTNFYSKDLAFCNIIRRVECSDKFLCDISALGHMNKRGAREPLHVLDSLLSDVYMSVSMNKIKGSDFLLRLQGLSDDKKLLYEISDIETGNIIDNSGHEYHYGAEIGLE